MSIRRRFGPAFLASLAWHIAIVAMLWLATRAATRPIRSATVLPDRTITHMVWLNDPGPGGGGGGGGNRMTDPPRRAELPGNDTITVRASRPRALDGSKPATHEQEPVQQLTIPVATWLPQRSPCLAQLKRRPVRRRCHKGRGATAAQEPEPGRETVRAEDLVLVRDETAGRMAAAFGRAMV